MLLSKNEIQNSVIKLQEENMPFVTVEEALEYANVNILTNATTLLCIIKIPFTQKEIYNNVVIKPAKRINKTLHLKFNQILTNGTKIFGIKDKCTEYSFTKICKRNQIVDISNDNCIVCHEQRSPHTNDRRTRTRPYPLK